MKKQKIPQALAALLCLAAALSLSACGKHEHTWVDATCTTPKTCAGCGKTEGEVLSHTWKDATCAAPKTCAVCGETEGEVLSHIWEAATCAAPKICAVCGETEGEVLPHTLTEANYQAPATCSVCGATEGDVLTPDFVAWGLPLAELGQTYDCELRCYQNASKSTVAHITVTDYQVFESNDTLPAKEGYEYRQVTFTVLCDDENAQYYGVDLGLCIENYYDIKGWDESTVRNDDGTTTYTVSFNGQKQECKTQLIKVVWDDWAGKTLTGRATYTFQVPAGYDGVVAGLLDKAIKYSEGVYITDIFDAGKFILFRLA